MRECTQGSRHHLELSFMGYKRRQSLIAKGHSVSISLLLLTELNDVNLLLTAHVFSHEPSDFNHVDTQFCIDKRANREFSLKVPQEDIVCRERYFALLNIHPKAVEVGLPSAL